MHLWIESSFPKLPSSSIYPQQYDVLVSVAWREVEQLGRPTACSAPQFSFVQWEFCTFAPTASTSCCKPFTIVNVLIYYVTRHTILQVCLLHLLTTRLLPRPDSYWTPMLFMTCWLFSVESVVTEFRKRSGKQYWYVNWYYSRRFRYASFTRMYIKSSYPRGQRELQKFRHHHTCGS